MGLTPNLTNFIEDINKSKPKLTDEDKVSEFKTRQFNYISDCLAREISPKGIY